jgi:hypothetical protein
VSVALVKQDLLKMKGSLGLLLRMSSPRFVYLLWVVYLFMLLLSSGVCFAILSFALPSVHALAYVLLPSAVVDRFGQILCRYIVLVGWMLGHRCCTWTDALPPLRFMDL